VGKGDGGGLERATHRAEQSGAQSSGEVHSTDDVDVGVSTRARSLGQR
jgi:hypothetical protein